MATRKVTVALDDEQLARIRAPVAGRSAPSVSGFVQHAVAVGLVDGRAGRRTGSVGSRMRLTLGPRTYDLTTRALVVGPGHGADIAELSEAPGPGLVHLASPTPDLLERCAAAGAVVIVPPASVDAARAAGLPSDRIVPDTLLLDVTGTECPVAATAVGVIRGARIVRTADVRGARRICDVLAAVMEAR